jgi:hypothetical protein
MDEFGRRLACVIRADDSCKFNGTSQYHPRWQVQFQGVVKTDFAATVGSGLDEPVASRLITFGFNRNPVDLQAHTFDPSGNLALRSFHIGCFRD